MKKVWIARRTTASIGQTEFIGYFGTRQKAVAAVLVTAQNDFSINQRWPELQEFDDISVSVESMGSNFKWITVIRTDGNRRREYTVNGCAVH